MRDNLWRQVVVYGALLAAGTLALQWLDYQFLARTHSREVILFLVAAAFLGLGVYIGVKVISRPATPAPFDGNPKARDALGLSSRELEVLGELAAGRSNKEIAAALKVSPNTVKTHVAKLYEKLGAKRRTDAVNRARELGILP
jgi:DNA-binding CsgD family transcriptional regulator